MTLKFYGSVPPGTTIHIGPKGGEYILSPDGQKRYLIPTHGVRGKSQKFCPKRGAFLRFIENQAINA